MTPRQRKRRQRRRYKQRAIKRLLLPHSAYNLIYNSESILVFTGAANTPITYSSCYQYNTDTNNMGW